MPAKKVIPDTSPRTKRIAFVSCSNITMQKDNQPIWGVIHAQKPDLLLLLGDNVYLGTDDGFNANVLEQKYKKQLAEPHFNKLLCEVPYLVIWDNHDMGVKADDYQGLSAEELEQSRDLFYRYLKYRSVVPYSVIPGTTEIYCTHTIGNVKFIMLDVRSHQENPDGGDDASLLGKNQEDWLCDQLGSDTGINVICSGISYSYGKVSWTKYKTWCHTFNNRVAETSKPLFLGGSIHKNYFEQHEARFSPIFPIPISPCIRPIIPGFPPPRTNFYEIISSSVGRNIRGKSKNPPLNNYGIIDIGQTEVEVTLYSQKVTNIFNYKINRDTWELI